MTHVWMFCDRVHSCMHTIHYYLYICLFHYSRSYRCLATSNTLLCDIRFHRIATYFNTICMWYRENNSSMFTTRTTSKCQWTSGSTTCSRSRCSVTLRCSQWRLLQNRLAILRLQLFLDSWKLELRTNICMKVFSSYNKCQHRMNAFQLCVKTPLICMKFVSLSYIK